METDKGLFLNLKDQDFFFYLYKQKKFKKPY